MGPSRLGADDGITALYAAHWAPMVRLAWLLTGDQSVAEEIVQDALVRMHRRWDQLAGEGQPVGYLRTCVVNGARSAVRHRKVVERQVQAWVGAGRAGGVWTRGGMAGGGLAGGGLVGEAEIVPSAESQVVARAEQSALVAALRQLPQRQREVLTLRYFHDLSEAEIAQHLGISAGSVKAHAHRGLSALRIRTHAEDVR